MNRRLHLSSIVARTALVRMLMVPLAVVLSAATAAAAVTAPVALPAPLPAPVSNSHFKIIVPHIALDGGTASMSLAGPPGGLELFSATWILSYTSPHGGTPASQLIVEISLPGLSPLVVTGADLGWPATSGSFSGTFTSSAVTGVVEGGAANTAVELLVHSTTGGVIGQVGGAVVLELEAICQKDAGHAGPGNVQLSICGDVLASGGHADLVLTGAPPSAPLMFLAGITGGPIPFKGGQLVPKPRLLIMVGKADPTGSLNLTMPGGGVHIIFFLQVAVADPSQTNGVALSNALIVELML